MSHAITVTDDTFEAEVLSSTTPVLVLFRTGRDETRPLALAIEHIAADYPDLITADIDLLANPKVSADFQIGQPGFPIAMAGAKVILFVAGVEKWRTGVPNEAELKAKLAKTLTFRRAAPKHPVARQTPQG
jgi:hypothetical protein